MNESSPSGHMASRATQAYNEHIAALRGRILYNLALFPRVTRSMLQVALGPGLSSSIWKPVLEDLMVEGLVTESQLFLSSPEGRTRTFKFLHLTNPESAAAIVPQLANALSGLPQA